jgi:hypothetical protein
VGDEEEGRRDRARQLVGAEVDGHRVPEGGVGGGVGVCV